MSSNKEGDGKPAPLVSIGIITYNQERYVDEAIRSAIEQDYSNIEIIVADDASKDATRERIEEWQRRHPDKIKALFNPRNLGVTGNLNVCLAACHGEFLILTAGDDVLLPTKVSRQVAWFLAHPQRVMCGHQVEVFYEDGRPSHAYDRFLFLKSGSGPERILSKGVPFCACATMVRMSNVPTYGFHPSLPWAADYLFWLEVLASGGEYGYVKGTLARYRRHTGNVTNRGARLLHEVRRTFKLFAAHHPRYASACENGLFDVYVYGRGFLKEVEGDLRRALRFYWQSLSRHPFSLKKWAAIFRCVLKSAQRRFL